MPYSETYIAHLILKEISNELTPAEALALQEWRNHSANNAHLYDELTQPGKLPARLREFEEAAAQAALVQAPVISTQTPAINIAAPAPPKGRRLVLRYNWLRYAAIFVLVAGGLLWYLTMPKTNIPVTVTRLSVPVEIDAAGYKATLTLADGSVITLDSSTGGAIAQQGSSSVVNTPNGEIRYEKKGNPAGAVMMNTMRTPRGGQYRLVLPDGTKVWLNAASSVTYPVAFTGNDRKVKTTGEVYFEVAKDRSKPFIVDVDSKETVEVLGTHFNINAYMDDDENAIRTTLLEGKVKVSTKYEVRSTNKRDSRLPTPDSRLLNPGEQAILTDHLTVTDQISIDKVMAWKNGIFDFTGASFQMLMKEVERWYDVDVKYEGAMPEIRFKGKMDRGVKLAGVIRFMNDYGVQTALDGRTLIIKGK
jgi:transmembrane sensor